MTREALFNLLRHLLLYSFLSVWLTGCGGVPYFRDTEPAPVEEAAGSPPDRSEWETGGVAAVAPYQPSTRLETTHSHSSAVGELLQTARRQREEGNLPEAVATVERALRIEPRNARLWNQLAHLRMDQQKPQLAAELAAKSNILAVADPELKKDNWLLIGQARRATGDMEGARTAERKARMVY
jgi:tetratricopeptide (TPR) repeat protein